MKKAELQYNNVIDLQNPALSSSSLNVQATLEHFAEVINEMQESLPTNPTNKTAVTNTPDDFRKLAEVLQIKID